MYMYNVPLEFNWFTVCACTCIHVYIFYFIIRLADVIVQYEVNSPDSILPSHTNREDKKHSIIDALRLVCTV